jgi:hypothetical protein
MVKVVKFAKRKEWQRIAVMQVIRVPLRRLHNYLRLSLPVEFCKAQGLHEGDYADIVPDNGAFKLRFVKVEQPAEMAESA